MIYFRSNWHPAGFINDLKIAQERHDARILGDFEMRKAMVCITMNGRSLQIIYIHSNTTTTREVSCNVIGVVEFMYGGA